MDVNSRENPKRTRNFLLTGSGCVQIFHARLLTRSWDLRLAVLRKIPFSRSSLQVSTRRVGTEFLGGGKVCSPREENWAWTTTIDNGNRQSILYRISVFLKLKDSLPIRASSKGAAMREARQNGSVLHRFRAHLRLDEDLEEVVQLVAMDIITKEALPHFLGRCQRRIPCSSTNQIIRPSNSKDSNSNSLNPSVHIIPISCTMYRNKPSQSTMLNSFRHGSPHRCKCCPTSLHPTLRAKQRMPHSRSHQYYITSKYLLLRRLYTVNKTLRIAPRSFKLTPTTWVI